MAEERMIETDVLVIGGGIAGAFAAIRAREKGLNVTLVDKSYMGKSGSTAGAGMGFMVFNADSECDLDLAMKRTAERSEYINHREWTEIRLKESWAVYESLVSWGVEFPVENEKYGTLIKGPGGILTARIKRRGVAPPLRQQALKVGVTIMDKVMITDLIKHDGKVVGAVGFPVMSTELDFFIFKAKATVIAAGRCMLRTPMNDTNSATGDGQAIAYGAGAEFEGDTGRGVLVGFSGYPSWRGGRSSLTLSALFVDSGGKSIALPGEADFDLELAFHEGRGPIYFDLDAASPEDIDRVWRHQQNSDRLESERMGFDPRKRGKYQAIGGLTSFMGGAIWPVDTKCTSTLPGLYTAGDSIALAGAGLSGSGVTGNRAGLAAAEYASKAEKPVIDAEELARARKVTFAPIERKSGFNPRWVTQQLINTMQPYYIFVIKHEKRLQAAITMVEFYKEQYAPKLLARDIHELRLAHETKNMLLGAEMTLKTSLFRTESRGTHYREDYPRRDDPAWLAWVKLKDEGGKMKLWKEAVPEEWWPDLSKPYEERYPRRFPGE